jgi:hypothetical protein
VYKPILGRHGDAIEIAGIEGDVDRNGRRTSKLRPASVLIRITGSSAPTATIRSPAGGSTPPDGPRGS